MASGPLKLTDRDGQLLVDVYKHKFLTVGQVQRLHFPSLQTAYRRLRILKQAKFVSVFSVPGIEEYLYRLSPLGYEAIAGVLGVSHESINRHESTKAPRDYYFTRHFLAINDFRITLRLACADNDVKLLGFIPEYFGEKESGGRITRYIKDIVCDLETPSEHLSHTPDAVFALQRGDNSVLFFVEVDRGTEVLSDPNKGVLKALKFYVSYLQDGKYTRYEKDFRAKAFKGFRTLIVTNSEIRAENIRNAAEALAVQPKLKRFIWVATTDAIDELTVFGPLWKSIDGTDQSTYSILKQS